MRVAADRFRGADSQPRLVGIDFGPRWFSAVLVVPVVSSLRVVAAACGRASFGSVRFAGGLVGFVAVLPLLSNRAHSLTEATLLGIADGFAGPRLDDRAWADRRGAVADGAWIGRASMVQRSRAISAD